MIKESCNMTGHDHIFNDKILFIKLWKKTLFFPKDLAAF